MTSWLNSPPQESGPDVAAPRPRSATHPKVEETVAEILPRLKKYDQAAWRQAFALLHPVAVRGAAAARTNITPQDREEVAGDALIELAHQIETLDTWSQLAAFAFVAAQRRAVDRLRRLRAQKRHSTRAVHLALEAVPPHELVSSEVRSAARWMEISGVVDTLIAGLGEPAASLVRGYTKDGLSYEQLSRRANMPLGTVAAIVYRSLRRLEKELGPTSKLGQELSLYL